MKDAVLKTPYGLKKLKKGYSVPNVNSDGTEDELCVCLFFNFYLFWHLNVLECGYECYIQ